MKSKLGYGHTVAACHIGYVSQAIVNNFSPLLFVTFLLYGVKLWQLSFIVLLNFGTQLAVDLICVKAADKIGYRPLSVAAHLLIAAGLVALAFLPRFINPFWGIVIPTVVLAVGGGIDETLVSPIVESCPTSRKAAAMSLLHSSYCWGTAAVILLSTAFFAAFGTENWPTLACLFAIVPLANAIYFMFVPIVERFEKEEGTSVGKLFKNKMFAAALILMLLAGAAELSVSQWASAFAEKGLNVAKPVGDVLGPCMFALLMGTSRVIYAAVEKKVKPEIYLGLSAFLLFAGYLVAALSPIPALSLAGCGICGFAVGPLWPGLFSYSSARLPKGGTPMFALLALAGDLGAATGPAAVGWIAGAFGEEVKMGLLFASVLPLILSITLAFLWLKGKKSA